MSYGQYSHNRAERTNPLAETPNPKRQKQVFDIAEIPHLWAHKTQDCARNSQGNFYFTGGVIYSYSSHFPIAAHVTNKRDKAAILFTTGTYGPTTGRHVSSVRYALPPDAVVFEVPLNRRMIPGNDGRLDYSDYAAVIAAYQSNVHDRVQDALDARLTHKIQSWLDMAHAERNELLKFVQFFGLPKMSEHARIASRKLPIIPASVDAAKEMGREAKRQKAAYAKEVREQQAIIYAGRIKDWMSLHPEYAARWDGTTENAEVLATEHRTAENARQEEERLQKKLADITGWMSEHADVSAKWDGTFEQGFDLRQQWNEDNRERIAADRLERWLNGDAESMYNFPRNTPTLLRIVGDTVETSHGVNFPVSHAVRGLALVRSVMSRGEDWHTNGHTCRLGHYNIDTITADGTVYAGCHTVPFSSIERIAAELEAYSAPELRECGKDD